MSTIIRGIYSAATGMLAQQFVQDALASNLANANTAGYKQDMPTFRALSELAVKRFGGSSRDSGTDIGNLGMGAAFDHTTLDMSAGDLERTDDPLNVALTGSGFFTVQTSGGVRLTRAGDFHIMPGPKDASGKQTGILVDSSNNPVLGLNGTIKIGTGSNVTIDPTGSVIVNGTAVDHLRIVDAPASALKKEGGNLLKATDATTKSTATVRSGFVEKSNVNAVGSMVKMITVQRAYDAAQKAILTQDDALSKTVNDIAR